MKVTYELDLDRFEAWSGGQETLNRIRDESMEADFEALLEDVYPDGIDETELNDLLRFEADWIYESLGMKTDEELENWRSWQNPAILTTSAQLLPTAMTVPCIPCTANARRTLRNGGHCNEREGEHGGHESGGFGAHEAPEAPPESHSGVQG